MIFHINLYKKKTFPKSILKQLNTFDSKMENPFTKLWFIYLLIRILPAICQSWQRIIHFLNWRPLELKIHLFCFAYFLVWMRFLPSFYCVLYRRRFGHNYLLLLQLERAGTKPFKIGALFAILACAEPTRTSNTGSVMGTANKGGCALEKGK